MSEDQQNLRLEPSWFGDTTSVSSSASEAASGSSAQAMTADKSVNAFDRFHKRLPPATYQSYTSLASRIMEEQAAYYGVTVSDLRGRSKRAAISAARRSAMRNIHARTTMSLTDIAELFNKHHTTVLKAVQDAEANM